MVAENGIIPTFGNGFARIMLLGEYAVTPAESVTDSRTLNVPAFANVIVLPDTVTPVFGFTV